MKLSFATASALALLAFAPMTSTAFAEDQGKHWYFDVDNTSNGAVVEFRTQEEGEWSENWIDKRIEPGDTIKLDFETNEGSCVVRTQIHMLDGTYFDAPVDYCKAKTLEVQNGTLIWK